MRNIKIQLNENEHITVSHDLETDEVGLMVSSNGHAAGVWIDSSMAGVVRAALEPQR